MKYVDACRKAEEYAEEKGIVYEKIDVLEFEQEWWFSYIPKGENYTNCIKIAIDKEGTIRKIYLPVPPLQNLKIYQAGKRIECIQK